MTFVIDKSKSRKGASVSEEFALFSLKLSGIYRTYIYVKNKDYQY